MFKIVLLLLSLITLADDRTTLYDFRFYESPEHTRVVFDTADGLNYQLQQNNSVIILQVKNAKILSRTYKNLFYKDQRIKKINIKRKGDIIKIFFYNHKKYQIKSFVLKPNKKYKHHRLVIDLIGEISQKSKKKTSGKTIIKHIKKNIVIDAGHGGEDPGAIGYKKSKEKTVVLSIAKKLQKLINKNPKLNAILSRKGDYFVNLSKRPKIAQDNNAIAFISIHADSVKRRGANGASVYVLSKKGGTTKFIKQLEKSENATDIFGNYKSITDDKSLNTIMTNLARENKKHESYKLAQNILIQLKKVGKLHKKTPQKANFIVLKTPAIPSVLVEVAFISNPADEKRLNNSYQQNRIAESIYKGIVNYLH